MTETRPCACGKPECLIERPLGYSSSRWLLITYGSPTCRAQARAKRRADEMSRQRQLSADEFLVLLGFEHPYGQGEPPFDTKSIAAVEGVQRVRFGGRVEFSL